MKRLRVASLISLLLVLSLVIVACGGGGGGGEDTAGGGGGSTSGMEGAANGQTIKVASDIAYRPFEFNKGGEPVGFDIDLLNEVGKRAGFKPQFQNVNFNGIIEGLNSNLYDSAISAMTITEDREKQIDFSDPYFNADQSLLVQSDSDIKSVDDLGDATVGVQAGTTGEIKTKEFVSDGKAGELRSYNTVEDAFSALENGQIDAVINDLPVSQDKVNTSNGRLKLVETIPTGEQYGIAFPTDSELVKPVNDALAEIKDDGTYAKIYKKWIGREPEEIP